MSLQTLLYIFINFTKSKPDLPLEPLTCNQDQTDARDHVSPPCFLNKTLQIKNNSGVESNAILSQMLTLSLEFFLAWLYVSWDIRHYRVRRGLMSKGKEHIAERIVNPQFSCQIWILNLSLLFSWLSSFFLKSSSFGEEHTYLCVL
jgi:hypothetical protein